jgi:hypothetical protein
MSCNSDASCNFPSGICSTGSCMCQNGFEGQFCQVKINTFLKFVLRFGLPALCIFGAVIGILLGGVSRWFYKSFQNWNKLRRRKTALFGSGWFDSDRYIGPNHHTVVVNKKKMKKAKKKKRREERGRSTSRSRSPARSRSRSRGRD